MEYLEFTFTVTPQSDVADDVLSAVLAEIGFDSFVRTDELDRAALPHSSNPEEPQWEQPAAQGEYKAYILKSLYSQEALTAALADFPLPDVEISYSQQEAEDKNWNEEWEKHYFKPLVVDGRCVISSTFHKDVPEAEYKILINPQMSFGTGHHATTSQMISRLLNDSPEGKEVLDMGCGTGILAILARQRGARHCVAIDIDEWCRRNAEENIALNGVDAIDVYLGDASLLPQVGPFDLVIANINLGILLRDLPLYVARMKKGAVIYMSGFYDTDVPQLVARAEACGLTLCDTKTLDSWACLKLRLPE